MRVHELAKETGVKSADVLAAAKAAGLDADHANDALTDDEAATLRAALAPPTDAPPSDAPAPDGPPPGPAPEVAYALVHRAGVSTVAGRVIERGDTVSAREHAAMPDWMQAHFEAAGERIEGLD